MTEQYILPPEIKTLGRTEYKTTWKAMKVFTDNRNAQTCDELWLTEHEPVFTQGLNGKADHLLDTGEIPVVQIDRGGQVTYHGPGQILLYCLLDISRLQVGVRSLVTLLEQTVIEFLQTFNIAADSHPDAPGVYVKGAKIAALGLKIRKGCCYHGLSFNHEMDLSPFSRINPCGLKNLEVTQLADFNIDINMEEAAFQLSSLLCQKLEHQHEATNKHL